MRLSLRPTPALPAALALLLAACGGHGREVPLLPCGSARPGSGLVQLPWSATVGEAVFVTVGHNQPTTCDGTLLTPGEATVKVQDEGGQQVPHSVTEHLATGVTVRFTPPVAGEYRVEARFSPSGGTAQQRLVALADVRMAAPSLELPAACAQLLRTASGAWLCDADVWRGGVREGALEGEPRAVDGRWVWTSAREDGVTRLRLYEDSGEGLPLERGSKLLPAMDALAVREDMAVVATVGRELTVLRLAAGQWLGKVGSAALPTQPPLDETEASHLLVFGERVLMAGTLVRDASSGGMSLPLCSFRLSESGTLTAEEPCKLQTQRVVGHEPGAVWLREQTAGSSSGFLDDGPDLRRYLLGPDGLSLDTWTRVPQGVQLHLPSPSRPPFLLGPAPIRHVTPRLEEGRLLLQLFAATDAPAGVGPGYRWAVVGGEAGAATRVWLQ